MFTQWRSPKSFHKYEDLGFVIRYKSLALILIKSNWFYPLGEKANCEGAFSFSQIDLFKVTGAILD